MNKKLIIFEMANNHMGDVQHGLNIISAMSKLASKYANAFDFAIKFQLRHIETFIHPHYKNTEHKYVKRFTETCLSKMEFVSLVNSVRAHRLVPICTAFDEESVNTVVKTGFETIKIGSCSLTDWPLLNKIAETNLSVIASVAGASLEDIDNVVSFFKHRHKNLSLMHCIGEYPVNRENFQLNQIDLLKKRYIDLKIGFSSHESPTELSSVQIAIAKGADLFEKHIGIENGKYKLNAYSASPEQMDAWLDSAASALAMCGLESGRCLSSEKEQKDLRQFKRGVFLSHDAKEGDVIDRSDVFYAFPNLDDQVLANDMSKYTKYSLRCDIQKNEPVMYSQSIKINTRQTVWDAVQRVKKFLLDSNVTFPGGVKLELSHHYGIEKFDKFGITMITVVNREYCKKLIIVLPGQFHPEQYHEKKEETFLVLFGQANIRIDGIQKQLVRGDVITIEPNQRHEFESVDGCVLEEVSSTHYVNDSFYTDQKITENKNRKTEVMYWL